VLPTVATPPAGIGYWVLVPVATALHIEGTDPPQTQYVVNLQKGWNQVGNPFPFAIDWNGAEVANGSDTRTAAQAAQAGWVAATVFTYGNGAYHALTTPSTTSLTILPFQGFWVYALQDVTLLLPPNPVTSQ
jgi:hypothetical protein